MTFRKTWFGYFLWGTYVFFVGILLLGISTAFTERMHFSSMIGKVLFLCLSIFLLSILFFITRLIVNKHNDRHRKAFMEAILCVVIIGVGIVLRVIYRNQGIEEAAYFDLAKVTGNAITQIPYGMQYIYLVLLRGVFYITGNIYQAGIILQIVLQCLSTIIWYFVIRRLVGGIGAILFLNFCLLSPQSIKMAITYSPKPLYIFLFGLVFLTITNKAFVINQGINHKKWLHIFTSILIGCLCGVLLYLDITAIIFILPIIGFVFLARKERKLNAFIQTILCILFMISGFLGIIYTDSMYSNVPFKNILNVYYELFHVKGMISFNKIELYIQAVPLHEFIVIVIMILILVMGIGTFFIRNKHEKQLLLYTMTIAVVFMYIYQVIYQGMTCEYLLLYMTAALTGAVIQALCDPKKMQDTSDWYIERIPEKTETPKIQEVVKEEDDIYIEQLEKIPPKEDKEHKEIHYIENPLPLPKKTVKKEMDYPREINDKALQYDYEVSEQDDYDIH